MPYSILTTFLRIISNEVRTERGGDAACAWGVAPRSTYTGPHRIYTGIGFRYLFWTNTHPH